MIRVVLLTISLSFAYTHLCFAQVTSDIPKAFRALHVRLPAGCSYAEKAPPSVPGNLPTTKCSQTAFSTATKVQAKVYRVVDGDTIHVYIGPSIYAIRMLGVDTPELHYLGKAQPVWAERARQSLASMVRGGDSVTLEFDREKCDRYGRILVHVFRNGVSLNQAQISRGVAANYCIAPNYKYCDRYADAYARARSERVGFHSDKCTITPYVWRKGIQGQLMDKPVKNRDTGVVYKPGDYYKIPVEDRIFALAQPKGI